jgi:hypothetical protein
MITEKVHSPEAPGAVITALRAHAGEWRESQLPETLKRAGVTGVDCTVDGTTCTLTLRRRWYGPSERLMSLRVRATVRPVQSGTDVQVVAAYHTPGAWVAIIGGSILLIVAVWLLRFSPLVLGGLALGLLTLRYLLVRDANHGLGRASDAAAEYLIGRVEAAIAEARRNSMVAPAS